MMKNVSHRSYSPSPAVISAVRACKAIRKLADAVWPSDFLSECPANLESYHVDLLGEYGPTMRIFFFVKNEIEIVGRVAIIETYFE
jgi:hypothetical protein